MKPRSLVVLLLLCPIFTRAAIKSEPIEYKQGDTTFQGVLYYDDADAAPRRAVLVCHEWWGLNEHARNQARRLAEAGYVGFALDMYGKGKVTTHPQDAQAFVAEVTKDPAVLAARFNADGSRNGSEFAVELGR